MAVSGLRTLVGSIALCTSTSLFAEVFVIVSKQNPVESLSKKEVVAIYTGKTKAFPGGRFAKPIDQPDDSEVKAEFYRKLTNRSVSQINSFWARLAFAGRYTPPVQLDNEASILARVADDDNAIAYVEAVDHKRVKVIYTIP